MAPIRNGRPGDDTAAVINTSGRTHHPPHISFGFVPLLRTNEAKYVHTLSVIRTDKAHFVRQFNRTKYPCKGCYLLSVHMLGI